jgi:hypothetical protein
VSRWNISGREASAARLAFGTLNGVVILLPVDAGLVFAAALVFHSLVIEGIARRFLDLPFEPLARRRAFFRRRSGFVARRVGIAPGNPWSNGAAIKAGILGDVARGLRVPGISAGPAMTPRDGNGARDDALRGDPLMRSARRTLMRRTERLCFVGERSELGYRHIEQSNGWVSVRPGRRRRKDSRIGRIIPTAAA